MDFLYLPVVAGSFLSRSARTHAHTSGIYIFDVLNGLCCAIIITIINLDVVYANFDVDLYHTNNDYVRF